MIVRYSTELLPLLSRVIHRLTGIRLHRRFTSRHSPISSKSFATDDVYLFNLKLVELSRAGKLDDARKMFDNMPERDAVSWNSIISAYWQDGCFEESKRLFDLMPVKTVVSWNSMISACIENGKIEEAREYFATMPEKNISSWNAMISGYMKCNQTDEARKLFEEMPRRNVISYTVMIDGFAKNGDISASRVLFGRMRCKNVVSWTVMINGYVENNMLDEAIDLYVRMPTKNIVSATAIVMGYITEGKLKEARSLFETFEDKDIVLWNTMIVGYMRNGHNVEALRLHITMLRCGLQPDQATLVSLLSASSILASVKVGRQIHVLVVKYGFESTVSICNALVTMYSRSGFIFDSELSFRSIINPDVISWNTIIAAFVQHGLFGKASDSLYEMRSHGLDPDGITFLSLLSGCDHRGLVEESEKLFKLMVNHYRIEPRSEHYACLVDTLCRAGELTKAYKVIEDMPFDADSDVWGALLAGCSGYLNGELGEIAANNLMKLEPQKSGVYVCLSNIYASAGLWNEVKRVRRMMREHGVKKQPAYSWMEIGNEVHFFLGGDVSHPCIEMIHVELRQIWLHMQGVDEVPDVVQGLWFSSLK